MTTPAPPAGSVVRFVADDALLAKRLVHRRGFLAFLTALLLAAPGGIAAQTNDPATSSSAGEAAPVADPEPVEDLFDLSLEELAQLPVTTVSGVAQGWFQTPAALYVITGDQIRRSGLRPLAEVLRLAPGLHVGRVDSRQWGIGARGFSDLFANKLQVLIDGRVVYNELFGGVYWDAQNPLLEDIERIEVVRGPGATLWGANAMNGVINVITKSARDTPGLYLSGGGGTEERAFAEGRYGARLGERLDARVWGSYANRSGTLRSNGERRPDDWDMGNGGFRLEFGATPDTLLTLQGEGYASSGLGQGLNVVGPTGVTVEEGDQEVAGGHVLARLEKEGEEGSGWVLQSYYDVEHRENITGFRQERDTVDVDFRHHFRWLGRNELVWGAGYRYRRTETSPSIDISLRPDNHDTHLATLFVQDTITLVEDRLFLMLGSKFEHNYFTGYEIQPSGRFWWTPSRRHTLWAAISRPVRRPSLLEWSLESRLAFPSGGSLVVVPLRGNDDLDAESMIAYEAGYRVKLLRDLTVDVAAFFFDYRDLIAIELARGTFTNNGEADSYGGEINLTWQPLDRWRLEGSYSFLDVDSEGPGFIQADGLTPKHRFQLHSDLDLTENLQLATALYFAGRVPQFDIDSYFRLDLGLTWRPRPRIELSVWGQNLTDGRHSENGAVANQETLARIERGAYARLTYRF